MFKEKKENCEHINSEFCVPVLNLLGVEKVKF